MYRRRVRVNSLRTCQGWERATQKEREGPRRDRTFCGPKCTGAV